MKSLVIAASALLACVAASSASASTIVEALGTGSFSADNAISSIPSTDLDSSNTYDFTFSWTGAEGAAMLQSDTKGATPVLQYDLYSGVPGSGAFQAESVAAPGASISFNAQPGAYYVQVSPSQIGAGQMGGARGLGAAVPEPTTWALMLIGVGGLGATLRSRRAAAPALA
jgi:hypothetical protein